MDSQRRKRPIDRGGNKRPALIIAVVLGVVIVVGFFVLRAEVKKEIARDHAIAEQEISATYDPVIRKIDEFNSPEAQSKRLGEELRREARAQAKWDKVKRNSDHPDFNDSAEESHDDEQRKQAEDLAFAEELLHKAKTPGDFDYLRELLQKPSESKNEKIKTRVEMLRSSIEQIESDTLEVWKQEQPAHIKKRASRLYAGRKRFVSCEVLEVKMVGVRSATAKVKLTRESRWGMSSKDVSVTEHSLIFRWQDGWRTDKISPEIKQHNW